MDMNIDLTPHLEEMVRQKVGAGLYASAREVVCEALRSLDEQERMRTAKPEHLREDIRAGVDSGSAGAWQSDQVKQDGRARRAGSAANPLLARITIEPGKRCGRPCLRGMRIAVNDVLELLSNGASHAEILEDFPDLEEDDIRAALAWAAQAAT